MSRHELFPIRAPLLALEHCIGPFLDDCDFDNNHRITFKEWAKCLELEEVQTLTIQKYDQYINVNFRMILRRNVKI